MANLILPKLKTGTDVRPPEKEGIWTSLESKSAFQNVASSLDYQASGETKSVSSVPTMWARPLSIEMALHNKSYPIRREMVAQWQGMLAAVALAEVRRFPLTAQLVDLNKLRQQNPFSRALYELLPNPVNVLYTLDGNNPWQEVYVFLWNNKPVGMTSPSTIVASSEEGNWAGLPWWNQETKCLESPLGGNHLNENEKALLWRWLENLSTSLHQSSYQGKPRAIDEISGLINEFRDKLGSYPNQALSLSTNPQFFGVSLNRGVLNGINYPAKAEAQPSNVKLIASSSLVGKVPDLLILDPDLAEAWGKSPQNIWIHQDQTLASLRLEDLKTGKTIWQNVRWIESKDLFLPELTFIDTEDALPGGYLPPENQPLIFNKKRITPLLPLNNILLEYFTPEDLIRRLNVTPLNSSEGAFIRIELDLPLSGSNNQPQNYRIYRDYLLKEENALSDGVPILEVWPHFQAQGWQEYYGFYYDAALGEETFQVSFPQAKEPHVFQQGRGNYQLTRLDQYPNHILCQSQTRQPYGLILLKTPPRIDLTGSWRVGIDFGTSFTNIYVNRRGTIEPLSLETLHHKVTEADIETRTPVLFEYFIPENFLPSEKPLPLSSILTTRGRTNCAEGKERVLFDGRIFNVGSDSFKNNVDWIEIDLKWDNFVPNRLFLEHLALHISAIAISKGIQEIQWCLSYPSAFSKGDLRRYARTWQDITDKLNASTGIKHICPEQDNLNYFRTESLAFAQYFADREEYNLVRSTCIDIGGGTSDISIWENNELIHQCSVRLAGRQLISQLFEVNIDFLCKSFQVDPGSWKGLKQERFYAQFDNLLRSRSEEWLRDKIKNFDKDSEFQGLVRLIALGTAGLYYYVGILLKVLHAEGKYSADEITPTYVGGNGSRLLNWLDNSGTFDRNSGINELFSYMLSRGSGFEDTEELTRLSQKPKDEVACGLVLNDTRLKGLTKKQRDPLIAGEVCQINGETIEYDSRLEWEDTIKDFKIPELSQLFTFVDEFNLGIQELELEDIKPMPQHQRGKGLNAEYKAKLYRDTKRELDAMLLKEFKKGDAEDIRLDAPFILSLKALLKVLAMEWADK
ncbi:hypothetical protein NIES4102_06950 [Chondrocystis sp. NIES-4102]|nr:hypothetical protein NIES4102_06950 [Chondrocystis sp. NIES-4102]